MCVCVCVCVFGHDKGKEVGQNMETKTKSINQ